MQGITVGALWDSGARTSLFDEEVAARLVRYGATKVKCKKPILFKGLGEGTKPANEYILVDLTLQDHKKRKLLGYVVPGTPHGAIIGLDFMQKEELSFLVNKKGQMQLFDHKKRGKPCVYQGSLDTHKPSGVLPVNATRVFKGKKKVRKAMEWWKNLDSETRNLLQNIHSAQLARITGDDLDEALKKANLRKRNDRYKKAAPGVSTVEAGADVPCDFPEVQQDLNQLISKYSSVFSTEASDVGHAKGKPAQIHLTRKGSVNERNYRTPIKLRPIMKKLIDDLLTAKIIEPCSSTAHNSPCILVPKKTDDPAKTDYRLVVDYRKLNKVIENVVYPIPRVQDILSEYGGCKVFSTVDIRHAFYTVQLDPASREITAFSCELGKWQFRFLPQGLKISPAIFQHQIERDLKGIHRTRPYMDDVLQGDKTPKQHLNSVEAMLQRMQDCGYKLKLSKCSFFRKAVTFTGIEVTGKGIRVTKEKREAAQKLIRPKTIGEVKSFLGFCSFLRLHVPYYCEVVGPIQSLLGWKGQKKGKDSNIEEIWTDRHTASFEEIKRLLDSDTVLAFPDSSKTYTLFTDASKFHMSAVLMQEDSDKNLKPIGYWSKSFKGPQLNWAALVKEARAVYEAVQHFDVFIRGCPITLRCDHKPLARFLEAKTKNEMVNRWSLNIQEYDIEFEWVASEDNISDCYSRLVEKDLFRNHDSVEEEIPEKAKSSKADNPQETEINASEPVNSGRRSDPSAAEDRALLGLGDDVVTIQDMTRLTDDQVKCMQQKDGFCQRMIKSLPNIKEDNGHFLLRNGLLYRAYYGLQKKRERRANLCLVIPKNLTLSVLVSVHKDLQHGGRDKMMDVLRTRVYWKRMDKQAAAFVRGCTVCHFRKLKAAQHKPCRIRSPKGPGMRLAVDLWEGGGGVALTAIDLHSQYPFMIPLKSKQAPDVCQAMQDVLACFKTPAEILTDNGPEFTSNLFKELMEKRRIKHTYSAPNHPQTNGIVERFHGFLNEHMRIGQNLNAHGEWWPAARAALEVYRKQPHTSTGESPLFLFTGQEPSYDLDHLLPIINPDVWNQETNTLDLQQLRVAQALARKNTALARQRNKVELKVQDRTLQIGDFVFRRNFSSTKGKLHFDWIPGYRVVSKYSNHTFQIENIDTKMKSKVARRHLRWADPVSALLANSNVDVFPGRSKLFFSADDLKDLHWAAMDPLPEMSPELKEKLAEVSRDRANEDAPQQEPPVPPPADPQPTAETAKRQKPDAGPAKPTRAEPRKSGRIRKVPRKLTRDYVLVNTVTLCIRTKSAERSSLLQLPRAAKRRHKEGHK
jgi:hypothetical protein